MMRILPRLGLIYCLLPAMAFAQNVLPMLPVGEESKWQAIGRVTKKGQSREALCTGTLVAPSVVVTAAHCAFGKNGKSLSIQDMLFVAGADRDTHAGIGRVAQVEAHPWAFKEGGFNHRHDVAVLHLTEPMEEVTPLSLGTSLDSVTAIVGYQRKRPERLSARFDCATRKVGLAYVVGCPVRSGHSGSPLLLETQTGWEVIGTISARQRNNAYAVPVDAWLLSRLND